MLKTHGLNRIVHNFGYPRQCTENVSLAVQKSIPRPYEKPIIYNKHADAGRINNKHAGRII
jgi:hypothetical protein